MFSSLFAVFFPQKQHFTESTPNLTGLRPVRLSTNDLRIQGIMYLDGLIAVSSYAASKDLQQVIRQFKYGKKRTHAVPLGRLLADIQMLLGMHEKTLLCPVPLHWSRRFSRGFNQAELLAREISSLTHIPIVTHLRRTRPTGHQAWRSHDDRRLAMHDAFVAPPSQHLHVTLVDDVATTMSTLDACASALKKVGVQHVDAIVVALG